MALKDPVVVHSAKSNTEAMMLCHVLNQAGIEAHQMDDLSLAGLWMGGTIPHMHLPKVWVDKADADRAASILQQCEQTRYDHEPERAQGFGDETLVQAVCEECGQASMFSSRILGSVQECPACGGFMDVESAEDRAAIGDEWDVADDDDNVEK